MAKQKVNNSLFNSVKKNPLVVISIFLGIFLLILSILLSSQYFQQDEWHSFGLIQAYGLRYITLDQPLWISLLSDRVGARMIMYVLFNLFGTNATPYGLYALFIHSLNSFLIFILMFKTTRNKVIGLISSVFFLINSVADQAYSWFGTVAGSATSVTFMLLSLIFYFNFLKIRRFVYGFISLVFLWVSFFFKELGYFLLVSYPLIWLSYTRNKSLKLFIKENILIIIYGAVMTMVFAWMVIFMQVDRVNYMTPQISGYLKVAKHFFLYPLAGISQIFIPSSLIFGLAWLVTRIIIPSLEVETSPFDQFYSTTMAEIISIILSISLIVFFILAYKVYVRRAKESIRQLFFGSLTVLLLGFLPYIVIDKFDAYLDSRYYYSVLVGASMIMGVTAYSLLSLAKNRKIFIMLFVSLFIYHGATLISNQFKQFLVSRERISIISQIQKIMPVLPKKTVFFITGSSPGYYGMPELKVPFQSGLGQMLLVIYGAKNQVDPHLFAEGLLELGFLYDTLDQGYREYRGQGFGYFWEKRSLDEALKNKKFDKNSVVSLFYDPETKLVIIKKLD